MLALWGVVVVALAQESPRPTALEVLLLDPSTACPDVPEAFVPAVVRTNRGIAFHRGDGSYSYGCPSTWGGDADAAVSVRADQSEALVVADGVVYLTVNGGCTAEPVMSDPTLVPFDTFSWRDALWVVAEQTDGDGGALLRWSEGVLTPLLTWDSGFTPSGAVPAGPDSVWLSGVNNDAPQVRRISLAGGLSGDVPLPDLPVAQGITSLIPLTGDEDEGWFEAASGTLRNTWHAQVVTGEQSQVVVFTDTGERVRTILGPAKVDDTWVGVFDGVLFTSGQLTAEWVPSGVSVPWTCLHQVGLRTFACTVPAMLAVTGFSTSVEPETTEVFTFAQFAPPEPACGGGTCATEWLETAAVTGLTDDHVAGVCPDGRTLDDLDPSECGCRSGGPGLGWVWLAALAVVRRRR